jgi:hypothetical protein
MQRGELILPTGHRLKVQPRDGLCFTPEELCRYVDGNIESLKLRDGSANLMWVNKTGFLNGLAVNRKATLKASTDYGVSVVGPVIIVSENHCS